MNLMNITNTTCTGAALSTGEVGVAFALVIGSGLATTLGAAVPCLLNRHCCRNRCMRRGAPSRCICRCDNMSNLDVILAIALAFSAGVMIYVSFAEIYLIKGLQAFQECVEEKFAHLYATITFFGGMLLAWGLQLVVHGIEHQITHKSAKPKRGMVALRVDSEDFAREFLRHQEMKQQDRESLESEEDPSDVLYIDQEAAHDGLTVASIYSHSQERDSKQLMLMSIFAGLAIAIHNFPEGLATFVGALEDPAVGVLLAIAVAIHNIPEGMVVAVPVYIATGSRVKGFLWGALSGITEPIGALLGYAVLAKFFDPIVYGVLFCLVAGMMVWISMTELLPTARRYDTQDDVTSWFLVIGMLVMALSLVLFQF